MINNRLPMVVRTLAAAALIAVVGNCLYAQQVLDKNVDLVKMKPSEPKDVTIDNWEPNNTSSSVYINPQTGGTPKGNILNSHYSQYDITGSFFRGQNGAAPVWPSATNDDIFLEQGDEDWWYFIQCPAGTLHVALHQMNDISERIGVEIYLDNGGIPTLIAGPQMPVPFYREFTKAIDGYDGVVMDVPISTTFEPVYVKLFEKAGPGSWQQSTRVHYELSVECEWGSSYANQTGDFLDTLEGVLPNCPTNNFFLDCAADVTPAGGNQMWTCSYTGYDYYKVVLTNPSAVSVTLMNTGGTTGLADSSQANPAVTIRYNYDLYWISGGGNYGFVPNPFVQNRVEFEGAPDQWNFSTGGFIRCTNPQANANITTPTLAPGTYYFLVMCWDSGTTGTNGIWNINGVYNSVNNRAHFWPISGSDPYTYTLRVTTTPGADDQYDTAPNNNDTPQTAALLLPGVAPSLRLYWGSSNNEQDWYKVILQDGDTLEVRMDIDTSQNTVDDYNLQLYRPATGTNAPGIAADMIDESAADQIGNKRLPFKYSNGSTQTPYECVGTWGTVGLVGNTRGPAGTYYIRVMVGPVGDIYSDVIPTNGVYNLTIHVNGFALGALNQDNPISVIAPEDAREPDDNLYDCLSNPNTVGQDGLTRNQHIMDYQDWYKVAVTKGDSIQVTLVYDAVPATTLAPAPLVQAPGVDLDVLVYDMYQNVPVGTAPNTVDVPVYPYLTGNVQVEPLGTQRVTVSATAGVGYAPAGPVVNGVATTSPNAGDIFIVVQRWGCRAARYDININVNGRSVISGLQLSEVLVAQPLIIDAGLNQFVDVVVEVENILTNPESLTSMSFNLIHEKGADVTGQYAISLRPANYVVTINNTPIANNPIPISIAPGTLKTFIFQVQGNPLSTNGKVSVFPDGLAGQKQIPGLPHEDFTTVNGNPPGPAFTYTILKAAPGSNLTPGGSLVLEVTISNVTGTTAGIMTMPSSIVFTRSGLDVTTEYTLTTNSPVVGGIANGLPYMLTVGQDVAAEFTYGISSGATEGPVVVTFHGGGVANPDVDGVGTFTVGTGYGNSFVGGSSGGGCASAAGFSAPWLLIGALFVVAALAQRKRRNA